MLDVLYLTNIQLLMANRIPLIQENCFHKMLESAQSAKIVHLKNLVLYSILEEWFSIGCYLWWVEYLNPT